MFIFIVLLVISNILSVLYLMTSNRRILEAKARLEERVSHFINELNIRRDYYEIKAENLSLDDRLAQQKEYIGKLKDEMNLTFRNISNEIIRQQKQDFSEQQKNILLPFEGQIKDFKTKIEEVNRITIENKISLEEQIKILNNNNQNLAKEAQDLTTALKGNKKLQGDWGEIQLENLFKIAGLNEGVDYIKQETIEGEDGKIHRPDYIINMPNNRRVVIDSKISLNNYVNYVSCEDESEKQKYLQDYVENIKNHIKELSNKEYYKELKKSISLDYVFMFIPLERAYIDAIDSDRNNIYKSAFDGRIAIVTPSSLMPILKTIEHLWNIEKQNKNIGKIVDLAERIYNKIIGFKDDLEDVGKHLDKAKKSYYDAVNKISEGKGNVLKTAQEMKELGIRTNKQLEFEYNEEEK